MTHYLCLQVCPRILCEFIENSCVVYNNKQVRHKCYSDVNLQKPQKTPKSCSFDQQTKTLHNLCVACDSSRLRRAALPNKNHDTTTTTPPPATESAKEKQVIATLELSMEDQSIAA
jgi:hypothetical protein